LNVLSSHFPVASRLLTTYPLICSRVRADKEELSKRGLIRQKRPVDQGIRRDHPGRADDEWTRSTVQVKQLKKRYEIQSSELHFKSPSPSQHQVPPTSPSSRTHRPQRSIPVPDYLRCTTPFYPFILRFDTPNPIHSVYFPLLRLTRRRRRCPEEETKERGFCTWFQRTEQAACKSKCCAQVRGSPFLDPRDQSGNASTVSSHATWAVIHPISRGRRQGGHQQQPRSTFHPKAKSQGLKSRRPKLKFTGVSF
jgi:hypothetical protein